MWIDSARIVDLDAGAYAPIRALQVDAGRITRIEDRPPKGVDSISVNGGYILPGLISCHTHLQGTYPYSTRNENESPATTALRAASRASRILKTGITTVRSVHELHAVDVHVRDAAQRGFVRAPRIFAGGRALTTTGGHGFGLGCRIADGPDGFLQAARTELSAGTNHVKIFLTGGLAGASESLNTLQMSTGEIAATCEAAREHSAYVVAHAGSSIAIQTGLQQGVRSFEHAYELDEATATSIAEAGAFLTPTLVVTHALEWMQRMRFPDDSVQRSVAFANQHFESVRTAIKAGVTLVNGTDFPPDEMSDGATLCVREMELAVQAGLSPLEAIRTATVNAAQLLGRMDLGRISEGSAADLIVVPHDPIADVSALRDIRLVVSQGLVVKSEH